MLAYLLLTVAFAPATFSNALAYTMTRTIVWAPWQSAVCSSETPLAHADSIVTACTMPRAILGTIHLEAQSP